VQFEINHPMMAEMLRRNGIRMLTHSPKHTCLRSKDLLAAQFSFGQDADIKVRMRLDSV
jgi:hypothetical protein